MPNDYDVIVVGVGSMGSATCYQLAKRGLRVLGLEQFNIPHSQGSHHGQSRMIRLAYFEHPNYVPLLHRAYELWRDLEERTSAKLLYVTGGLYMGPAESQLIGGALESCQQHGLAHELLSEAQVSERFPQFTMPDGFGALFETEAGFLLPQQCVAAHAGQALRLGAELRGLEGVINWSADKDGVTVETNQNSYRAGHVVFTGGAWSASLLGELGVELNVTRQVLAWFAPREHEPFELGTFPVWFLETTQPDGGGTGDGYYGFPIFEGSLGFKVALHERANTIDPVVCGGATHPDRQIRDDDIKSLTQFLQTHIPTGAGPLVSACVCFYTYSPDSHFIVDRHPNHSRVTLACGFSGHGFKFSSVMGEVLADLATKGAADLPIEFLGLSRFR